MGVTRCGAGLRRKLAAGFERKLSGWSVVMTEYAGPGEVGFAGDRHGPGRPAAHSWAISFG